jgi:sugar-specific transcriptional regulator TrmB
MNLQTLREIGLTEGESKVYISLLKLGSTTSGPLTDHSQVSRSKIYNILERLIKKGLVSFIIKEKTRYYQAEDPIKIQQYLDKREKEFLEQRKDIDKLLPFLQKEKNSAQAISEAQIYKGFKGIQAMIEHVYFKLKKGESYDSLGIPTFQEEKYHDYWKKDHMRRVKAGVSCRLLFNQGTDREILKNRNSYKGSEARYMPIKVDTPAWILVYKDVTVICLQSEESIAIEIINKQIADSFKSYFEAFWKLSKPFK